MKTNNQNLKSMLTIIAILLTFNGMLYAQTQSNLNFAAAGNTTGTIYVSSEEGVSMARQEVTVVPNPSTGPVTVRFSTTLSGKVAITVMNSNGAPLFAIDALAKIGSNQVPLDLSALGSGSYSVVVSGAGVYGRVVAVVK